MSKCAAVSVRPNVVRLALMGMAGIWLSGCSSDMTRLSEPLSNPFSNPFATASNNSAAPTPKVAAAPLPASAANPGAVAAVRPNAPVAVASLPAPAATGETRPPASPRAAGSGSNWSAVGGSPVIVAEGDNLDGLSRRYGVPESALLSANGLNSASQVHGGMRLVVPVYHAGGAAVAAAPSAKPKKGQAAEADVATPASKAKQAKTAEHKVAETATPATASKKKKQDAETAAQTEPTAKPRTAGKGEKPAATAPVATAKLDPPGKSAPGKADTTPTGRVSPSAPAVTAAQADASGATPEFRWPARGRIIQGFKAGGNDGINIAVPEGTSVRAAENGVVAYAGSELKGYGNLILIRHPNGFVSAYANNGELDVKRGETVKRGQVIAKSGQSGNVNSPQLHFELRKGSTPVDPTTYLAGL